MDGERIGGRISIGKSRTHKRLSSKFAWAAPPSDVPAPECWLPADRADGIG